MSLEHYISVIEDLSRDLVAEHRYQKLLEAIRQSIPCDAIALLRLDGEHLKPVALLGLPPETRGRRFRLSEQPRLKIILENQQLIRFDADSNLPDPYDGLVHATGGEPHVHDCMGISLYFGQQPWGVITFDAITPGQFDTVAPRQQEIAITLTRAVVTAAERIARLQQQLQQGHRATAEVNRELAETDVIGTSPAIRKLLGDVDTVAPTHLSVLIHGETGVGKELVARRLHLKSDRMDQPLIQLNCAALPETLAEAELFGHTRGAFTGATEARAGRFELAHGGTLFLDEVGELPLALQAKLLRVLQEGEIQRIGSDDTTKVDVRIVAATNRDLAAEVESGRFRADLYHRLGVFPVHVPPLRERGTDILQLAEFFLERDQHRLNIRKLLLTREARDAMMRYSWPGNVRELEHTISRAAIRSIRTQSRTKLVYINLQQLGLDVPGNEVAAPATPAPTATNRPPARSLRELTNHYQATVIEAALSQNGFNIAAAARTLGVDRSNLARLVKRHGIKKHP